MSAARPPSAVGETARWWAAVRARGPLQVPTGTAAPPALLRLPDPDGSTVWLLAVPPEQAGGGALDELGLAGPLVEQPNDTARVLAAVVRCCWADPTGPIWPGVEAPWTAVTGVFRELTDRDEGAFLRAAVAAVRRLHGAGWVRWDERARRVRLGPRAASWSAADLTVLRELHRQLPPPPADAGAQAPAPPATGPEPDAGAPEPVA